MDSHSNRIDPITIAQTGPRQTPKAEFGDVLARTADSAAQLAGGLMTSAVGGSPIVSAAVAGVRAVTSGLASGITGVGSVGGTAAAVGGASPLSGDGADLIQNQQSDSLMFLKIQDAMQKESQQFSAVSNILKVRHDSAKAAINNIR